MGASELAELYVVLRAVSSPMTRGFAEAGAAGESFTSRLKSGPMTAMANMGKIVTEGALGVAVASTKMAGDFQASMTRLVTSAGELPANLKTVSNGILKIATDTATSTRELSSGMYMIESAGFHGSKGLEVLRAAAEGAKAEGADLGTVGNALTTLMKDYHLQASDAIPAMNQLIATVAHGKTTMQDLAGALHSVLPIASAVKLSYAQIGGAIATMTSHGVSADLATQHLANLVRNLVAPNKQAQKAMEQFGLSVSDVKSRVGDLQKGGRGLSGTMELLFRTILQHVDNKTGLVLAQEFDQSKTAAAAAKSEFQQMPSALQKLAKEFLSGSGNVKGFGTEVSKLPVSQQQLLRAFEANSRVATGFSGKLKANAGVADTVAGALKKLTGGAVGLESALQLTGDNASDFRTSIDAIAEASKRGGQHVENWDRINKTFNFQMQKLREVAETLAIRLGSKLIPVVMASVGWFQKHTGVAKVLAGVIGSVLAASVAAFAARSVISIGKTAVEFGKLGAGGLKAGANLVRGFRSAETAAAEFSGKAGSLGGKARSLFDAFTSGAKTTGSAISSVSVKALELGKNATSSATTAAAGWASTAAKGVASAAAWVGQTIAKVAVVVATNVAGAATTAAAWIAANAVMLLGIGAVVAIIVGIVVLIIKYHRQIWAAIVATWNAIWKFISGIVSDVVGFVKDHWQLLLAIITGPIGMAVYLVIHYWDQISNAVSSAVSWVIDFVKNHWQLILAIITGPVGLAVYFIHKYWDQITGFFSTGVSKSLEFFRDLPGNLLKLVANFGKLLWNAGQWLVAGLINGIGSWAGKLWDAVVALAKKAIHGIMSTFGIASPSKVMHQVGGHLVQGLINGVADKMPTGGIAAVMSQGLGTLSGAGLGGGRLALAGGAAGLTAGGSSSQVTVINNITNLNVDRAAVVDGEKLYDLVQRQSLQHNRRNPTNGLSLH